MRSQEKRVREAGRGEADQACSFQSGLASDSSHVNSGVWLVPWLSPCSGKGARLLKLPH